MRLNRMALSHAPSCAPDQGGLEPTSAGVATPLPAQQLLSTPAACAPSAPASGCSQMIPRTTRTPPWKSVCPRGRAPQRQHGKFYGRGAGQACGTVRRWKDNHTGGVCSKWLRLPVWLGVGGGGRGGGVGGCSSPWASVAGEATSPASSLGGARPGAATSQSRVRVTSLGPLPSGSPPPPAVAAATDSPRLSPSPALDPDLDPARGQQLSLVVGRPSVNVVGRMVGPAAPARADSARVGAEDCGPLLGPLP
jgi:hypothetical protein